MLCWAEMQPRSRQALPWDLSKMRRGSLDTAATPIPFVQKQNLMHISIDTGTMPWSSGARLGLPAWTCHELVFVSRATSGSRKMLTKLTFCLPSSHRRRWDQRCARRAETGALVSEATTKAASRCCCHLRCRRAAGSRRCPTAESTHINETTKININCLYRCCSLLFGLSRL